MKKFQVEFYTVVERDYCIDIEAESEEEAYKMIHNGDYDDMWDEERVTVRNIEQPNELFDDD